MTDDHQFERSTRQWATACIRSDNLQLPYTSKLEVIWDHTTYHFLVYNLQLPSKYDGHQGWDGQHCQDGHHQIRQENQDTRARPVREDRQDRQTWHFNLTFQVTCVGQLSKFLRCFYFTWFVSVPGSEQCVQSFDSRVLSCPLHMCESSTQGRKYYTPSSPRRAYIIEFLCWCSLPAILNVEPLILILWQLVFHVIVSYRLWRVRPCGRKNPHSVDSQRSFGRKSPKPRTWFD